MLETYGFFDSTESDQRSYSEIDYARFVETLGFQGVHGGENALKVVPAGSGLSVYVNAGLALVDRRWYALENDGSGEKTLNLTVPIANPRIDRIVLRLTFTTREIHVMVKQGTEAAAPEPPALIRNNEYYEISLAAIRVPTGASTIQESYITDERLDVDLCGMNSYTPGQLYNLIQTNYEAAMRAAAEAKEAADNAQGTADEAKAAAGVTSVNGSKGDVTVKVGVNGASEGHVAVFDKNGNLATSGRSFWAFTRCTMSLSGKTLTITTLS